MRLRLFFVLSLFLSIAAQPTLAFDFSPWDTLLKKYVTPKTIAGVPLHAVNYRSLGKDPLYSTLIKELAEHSLAEVSTREEQLAYWINVYNIMAVKMVLDHYPVESIKDAGSMFQPVWNKPVGIVAGKTRTLNNIEHDILRKMGEPRIHVAIVCASVSCPDLRTEAYTAASLNQQLDDQLAHFLANDHKGLRLDPQGNRLYLSLIFQWFKEDFDSQGGVVTFLTPYAPEAIRGALPSKTLKRSYLDYNWDLNSQ